MEDMMAYGGVFAEGGEQDETLIDLKALCIRLDNRYIKDYKILRNETMTVIEIDV